MTASQINMTDSRTPAQLAVAQHLRLLTTGSLDAWVELFVPDAVFAFPFAPAGMATQLQGRDVLLAHMHKLNETFDVTAVDLHFVETASPQRAVATWVLDGTATLTGKPFTQQCIGIVSTDTDGRITRYDDYWNPLVAIEALTADTADKAAATGVASSFGG